MNRFHNKYHRHNHHSLPTAGEPDSAHDPIATKDSPFKGEFHVDGQLSAVAGSVNNLTVSNNFVVSGKSFFHGEVNIDAPTSFIFEHLTIVPKSTTQDYYFKIDSNFNSFPLMEVYLNSAPIFMITTAGDVGIGTTTPQAKLDVNGNIKCIDLSAINIYGSNNLRVGQLTANNTSRIGYLEIGYVTNNETYLKTISGNRDLWFYAGNNLNLKMHPTGKNYFPGKVGIGMEPVEPLTLSGQMGFRTNGLVLLDNSYYDTLRVITNRDGDDDQHLFTFTYDGRYVVGDIFHDYTYPIGSRGACGWGALNSGKVNIVETRAESRSLHLTTFDGPPIIRMYRVNGDPTVLSAVRTDQQLGGVYAFGYNTETCYGDRNVSLGFAAANDYTGDFQGAYTYFETTCATDPGNLVLERFRIDHNGNVGINTNNFNNTITPTALSYRNTVRPDWKLTVRDYDTETRPATVIFAGVSADPMVQIIGGEGKLEQTALMLSDRNIEDANTNHIEFTHGSADRKIARVSSLNRGAEGINGGSLLFSTTPGGAAIIPRVLEGSVVDPSTGDIYTTDSLNHVILRVTPAGRVVVFAGGRGVAGNVNGPIADARFTRPKGIAITAAGNLLVCDEGNGSIRQITLAGLVTTVAVGLTAPTRIVFAASGDAFVATGAGIFQVNIGTGVSTLVDASTGIFDMCVSGADLFATFPAEHVVRRFNAGGVSIYAGVLNTSGTTDGTTAVALLNGPRGIAVDATGTLFVGGLGSQLRVITPTGNVTTIPMGAPGFTVSGVRLWSVNSLVSVVHITIDAANNFIVTATCASSRGNDENFFIRNSAGTSIFGLIEPAHGRTITASPLPFERARINFDGDMGIGIKRPNSRLHVHDDDKSAAQDPGDLRDVVTVSTNNNTNGILLSSVNLLSRVYNNSSKKELHITTSTTDGKIKFGSDNEKFAAVITPKQKVGINIDEIIDTDTIYLSTWSLSSDIKLAVNGDTVLCNVSSAAAGGKLFFNRELSAVNTDPIYIFRHDNSGNISELRVNIGDDICPVPAGGTSVVNADYRNQDVFSIGNIPFSDIAIGDSAWNRWVDVGSCSTVIYNNLSVQGDATFDRDVTIKGKLSVVSPPDTPTVFRGDLYIDGNIYASGNITAFCGCAPPAHTTSKGAPVPAGWAWDPTCVGTHPPAASAPVACPSDIRLKLNPVPITDSLGKIMQVSGITFEWDETKQLTRKGRDVGVIAQEIEKILPEIVHEDFKGYKNVQYEKIIPLLIECIKELKLEIDSLKHHK